MGFLPFQVLLALQSVHAWHINVYENNIGQTVFANVT